MATIHQGQELMDVLRRILFLLAWIPVLPAFGLTCLITMLWAGVRWLAIGGDQTNAMLNPVINAVMGFPFWVLYGEWGRP